MWFCVIYICAVTLALVPDGGIVRKLRDACLVSGLVLGFYNLKSKT
jgi:hypothetical protein